MTNTYIATGKFRDHGAEWNISEMIYGAESLEEAQAIAAPMFARYSVYGGAYNCNVDASDLIEPANI